MTKIRPKTTEARAARPHDELIRELLDSRVPKSEREHAAAREIERLKSMTEATMGVGSGDGNLFVHGDYESIKAAQAIVLERDALKAKNKRLQAEIDALAAELVDEWKRAAAARSEAEARADKLEEELREAREFRDKLAKAIGNEQLRAFIEKHGEPVPLTNRVQAAEAEIKALRAEVAEWKRVAAAQAELHDEAEIRAERLAKALRLAEEHINDLTPEWYSAGQRVLAEIRTALAEEEKK